MLFCSRTLEDAYLEPIDSAQERLNPLARSHREGDAPVVPTVCGFTPLLSCTSLVHYVVRMNSFPLGPMRRRRSRVSLDSASACMALGGAL